MVDGWTYNPEYLRNGDKVLIIDDIFDSGRTINHLIEVILEKGIPRKDVRVAVHDYKDVRYKPDEMANRPDYYCRKHVINTPEEDIWIHYMSHELVGLTSEEIEKYYIAEDPELREVFDSFNRKI